MESLFTKKIYYKKYNHRMVIDLATGYLKEPKDMPTQSVITWLLAKHCPEHSVRSIDTYSHIAKKNQLTLFFTDPVVFEKMREHIGEVYIKAYERPMSKEHTEMLESNDKLVTRKQLFYNKYRMCLRVSPKQVSKWQTSRQNIHDMQTWCTEQFGKQYDNDRYMMSGYAKGNFYFADPKDALMFKLVWGGDDVQTERVVLVKELEEMKDAA